MTDQRWTATDQFLQAALLPPDPILDATLADARAAGLPPIDVAPTQGMLLHLLARLVDARRILEVGTLGGYSSIWLARALPADGRLISLELSARHAEVAEANLSRAGLAERVEIRVGRAADSLERLVAEGTEKFDLVFIDADKASNPLYLEQALLLTRTGSLIVVDNVVREGRVADESSSDPDIVGSRRVLQMMGSNPRLAATALQTVGVKGYDGLAIALVVAAYAPAPAAGSGVR